MYAVKSLFGFLILIPVFIAAFDMLGESFMLNPSLRMMRTKPLGSYVRLSSPIIQIIW